MANEPILPMSFSPTDLTFSHHVDPRTAITHYTLSVPDVLLSRMIGRDGGDPSTEAARMRAVLTLLRALDHMKVTDAGAYIERFIRWNQETSSTEVWNGDAWVIVERFDAGRYATRARAADSCVADLRTFARALLEGKVPS